MLLTMLPFLYSLLNKWKGDDLMFFQHILLAFDGTDGAEHALQKTKEYAQLNKNIRIHLVYVNEKPKTVIGDALITKPNFDESDLNSESITKLHAAQAELEPLASTSIEVLVSDQPADELIAKAAELQCDLIIIGSRGIGGLKKLFLGSVSSHVVNHASIPVLVIK